MQTFNQQTIALSLLTSTALYRTNCIALGVVINSSSSSRPLHLFYAFDICTYLIKFQTTEFILH